jgi:hypothetical protein
MELPPDLILNGATEDEVLLSLDLLKLAQMKKPLWSVDLAVYLYPKFMRAHYELAVPSGRVYTVVER